MKIYTTFFANLSNLPNSVVPISIALKPPPDWGGLQYKKLAPKKSFFSVWKEFGDNEYYTEHYNEEVLGVLAVDEVIQELSVLSHNANEIALVCYEKPDEFCHRHLVAKWLIQHGYTVKEHP